MIYLCGHLVASWENKILVHQKDEIINDPCIQQLIEQLICMDNMSNSREDSTTPFSHFSWVDLDDEDEFEGPSPSPSPVVHSMLDTLYKFRRVHIK